MSPEHLARLLAYCQPPPTNGRSTMDTMIDQAVGYWEEKLEEAYASSNVPAPGTDDDRQKLITSIAIGLATQDATFLHDALELPRYERVSEPA
jgi:hypothetical protein